MNIAKQQRCYIEPDGFTILELVIVLVILIAVSLIMIPTFSNIQVVKPDGTTQTPHRIATEATMNHVRDAVVGEDGVIESLSHKSNAMPRKINELVQAEAPEHIKQSSPELSDYDPMFRLGWRGPYLLPTGTNASGEPTLVDGWGNEFELQIDFDDDGFVDQNESKFVRLVSGGPNGQIETPSDMDNMEPGGDEFSQLTRSECGDDLVMFLRVPDNRR